MPRVDSDRFDLSEIETAAAWTCGRTRPRRAIIFFGWG